MITRPALLDGLLLGLTLTAGYMDAVSYLGLNGAFTANMTGNLVLLGMAAGQAAGDRALGSGISFAGFALGVAFGGRVLGHEEGQGAWRPHITTVLIIELVVLVLFTIGWVVLQNMASDVGRDILIALAAIAMGLQSSAGRGLGVAGVSTTYVTGTVTTLMTAIVGPAGSSSGLMRWVSVIVVTALGAFLGAVTVRNWPMLAAVPPVVLLAVVLLVAIAKYPRRDR